MKNSDLQSVPSIDEQRLYYDKWNADYRRGGIDEITDKEIRIRGLVVCELLQRLNLSDPRILEIGCGTGWLSEKLSALGAVTGIDLSPRAIAMARERKTQAEFIASDFIEHEFIQHAFDVVVCVETLFYVTDQPRFIQKMASLIRDGGYLVLTAINKFVYERRSDIGLPEQGQVRSWMSRREVRGALAPYFEILSDSTIEPRGDLGLLRLLNSYKLNRFLEKLVSAEAIKLAKEKLGLGGGIIILARKGV